MFLPLFLSLALGASHLPTTRGQNTTAVCRKEFDWMTNSRGQNPCLVTAWLWTPCYGGGNDTFVPPIAPDFVYEGPLDADPADSTPCDCNTVVYSVFAACGICQGAGIDPWPTYSTNCTKIFNGTYPEQIPEGTTVPSWAFLDVTRNSTFNVAAAKALAAQDLPDITLIYSSSSTSVTSATAARVSASTTSSPLSSASVAGSGSDTSTDPSQSHGINVGVIVGGAIGGTLGVLLVGVLVLRVLVGHHRTVQRAPSNSPHESQEAILGGFLDPYRATRSVTIKGANRSALYDADDPRTFPSRNMTYVPPPSAGSLNSGYRYPATVAFGRGVTSSGYRGYPQI